MPAPLGPRTTTNWPGSTSKSTPESAWTGVPFAGRKTLLSCSRCIIAVFSDQHQSHGQHPGGNRGKAQAELPDVARRKRPWPGRAAGRRASDRRSLRADSARDAGADRVFLIPNPGGPITCPWRLRSDDGPLVGGQGLRGGLPVPLEEQVHAQALGPDVAGAGPGQQFELPARGFRP